MRGRSAIASGEGKQGHIKSCQEVFWITFRDWIGLPFILAYLTVIILGSGMLYTLNRMGLMDL